jgi:biofilm PGA synthesis N-glycosyltransferase PgaC
MALTNWPYILFWTALGILFYCYVGYGLLIFFLTKFHPAKNAKAKAQPGVLPAVTLVISAFNEENVLAQKINNTLQLDYPTELLTVIFVTDGSTDSSRSLLARHTQFSVLHQDERMGKHAALKRAMRNVTTPVVVFSDANSMLNVEAISKMIRHFDDPKVGAVAGEKRIVKDADQSLIGEAEGLYWRYESFLKRMDASLYTVTGAAGELFSIRTSLFKESSENMILDDFIISAQICMQGFKIAYEPEAYAFEHPSVSLKEEEKRKVRISAGAYQSIPFISPCLNFYKRPLLSFQFISRRILRWIFCPPLIIALMIANIFIVMYYPFHFFYASILVAQIVFYVCAFLGWLKAKKERSTGIFTVPFYFAFMNFCLIKGFLKYMRGEQSALWEKSLRENGEWEVAGTK